ncbi:MAG: hypothetical protein ACRDNL_29355 [Spirillospora sp.]
MDTNQVGTVAAGQAAKEALEPLFRRLRATADGNGFPLGVPPDLCAAGEGWFPVAELSARPYDRLRALVGESERRWSAPPHVAAALWWKSFSYWAALPVAMGWALNRRVPLFTTGTTMVSTPAEEPGMLIGASELRVAVGDLAELGEAIGDTLVRDLLAPLIDSLHDLTRTGRRGLWGSVAEGLAHPIVEFAGGLVDDPTEEARVLLESVGEPVSGLVELLPGLRRRTCCLWVTLPDGEACPTCCVLDSGEGSRARE